MAPRSSLSSAALGFIVGYNNDYLFEMIKRIAEALLPKIGLDSVRREDPRPVSVRPVSVEELAKLLQEAKDNDTRRAIEDMIRRLTGK